MINKLSSLISSKFVEHNIISKETLIKSSHYAANMV